MLVPLPICISPIGIVKNKWQSHKPKRGWDKTRSRIVVKSEYSSALDGIEEYSHIVVLFWLDQVSHSKRQIKKCKPYGKEDIEEKGVLATRMTCRPNPIGVSAVRLLERKGNVLIVEGLDTFNKTPVLDIKPYTGHRREVIKDTIVPAWGFFP